MPEIQKTWVRFKQLFWTPQREMRETSDHTVEDVGMHHSNMVRDVFSGLQESLQKEQTQKETLMSAQAPVYHVVNKVQSHQK